MKFARLLSALSLIFFCSSVCGTLAQAPQTSKIVFTLIDDGQTTRMTKCPSILFYSLSRCYTTGKSKYLQAPDMVTRRETDTHFDE